MLRAAALVACVFLVPNPTALAKSIGARTFFTIHCWRDDNKDEIPLQAEFSAAKDKTLLWNGERTDWKTFRSYLSDIPRVMGRNGNIYLSIPDGLPHRNEIVSILAKQKITQHKCSPIQGIP
jgi:hypothetical protein